MIICSQRITYKTKKILEKESDQTKYFRLKKEEKDWRAIWWTACTSMEVHIGLISQSYLPIGRNSVPCYYSLLVCVWCDPKRKRLTSQSCKCLVWGSPIMAHAYPACFASFHPHVSNVSPTTNVHHIHQQPVPISLERESEPSSPYTWYPITQSNEYIVNIYCNSFLHIVNIYCNSFLHHITGSYPFSKSKDWLLYNHVAFLKSYFN